MKAEIKIPESNADPDIVIRQSEPGDAGYVAYMHGKYYHEHYGFGKMGEYYFIKYLADFVLDNSGGRLWIAESGGQLVPPRS